MGSDRGAVQAKPFKYIMPAHYSVQMISIRVGSAADAHAIAKVRRDSWHAAYEGIIPTPTIDRATAFGTAAADPPPYRRTVVAEAGEHPAVVGYASFGPERTVPTAFVSPVSPGAANHGAANPGAATTGAATTGAASPGAPGGPLTADGLAGLVGELYAMYVAPAWWSTGTGRALMGHVLTALGADGYPRAILWVLADNARARRFYERAGFTPDGSTNVITGLGGVLELRYARDL
jgi:GNAT superfamily N-acetyltransferase